MTRIELTPEERKRLTVTQQQIDRIPAVSPPAKTYGGYTLERLEKIGTLIPWRPCDAATGWFSEQNLQAIELPTAHVKTAVCSAVNAQPDLIAHIRELKAANATLTDKLDKEDKAHEQTCLERDAAEEALSHAYYLVTGRSPEWSSLFGHAQAHEDIHDAVESLKSAVRAATEGPTNTHKPTIVFHGPVAEHDYACPVCFSRPAVYQCNNGIMQPCWICQEYGWRVRRQGWWRWLLLLGKPTTKAGDTK